jgi:hypothetical protein
MYDSMKMETRYVCPHCGGQMEPTTTGSEDTMVCRDCGCCISKDETQNYDIDHCCPNCNQPLDGNECHHCGYDLGSDFE